MSSALLVLALALSAAEPPPNARAAVDKGVAYLRQRYTNGMAAGGGGGEGGHGLGEAALAGLAMLEGGAPPTDPAVQRIAAAVRPACLPDTKTYHIALCVLFLDRLGEASDRGLIQVLGVKLYLGLLATGGYTYECWKAYDSQVLSALQQDNTLTTKPRTFPKEGTDKGGDGFVRPAGPKEKEKAEPATGMHPLAEQALKQGVAELRAAGGRKNEAGDNSNTQFGLIGLWVAARNGLPADDAFELIERRFIASQNRDAGWSYSTSDGHSTPSMTCAGLLGLAVGAGRSSNTPVDRRKSPPAAGPGDGFVQAVPKKKEKDGEEALEGVKNKRAVSAALTALASVVRSSGNGRLGGFVGVGNEYYLLWSVERVCMAYNLRDLGGADWYQWGCDYLLPAQQADGSWPGVGLCSADVDTCFAILFLMKSNVVSDLSAKMGGGDRVMKAGENLPPPMTAPRTEQKKPPANVPPDPLVAATDAEFTVRLNGLRDAPAGSANTQALVQAIGKLTGDRQTKARTALAERLTRMTAKTLQGMMKPGVDEELRRAAATATAAKGEKSLLPELVGLITDSADPVVQAARAALQKLTGQDHGPPPGADDAARSKAQEAWGAVLK